MINKLGDDLLVEILIRLPHPRSAFLCKAVCKRWNYLISDPSSSFTRRFISHRRSSNHPPPPSLFLPSNDPQAILCFLPVPDGARPNPRVFDCFKDLILCGFAESSYGIAAELDRSYFVCNPFTKQWVTLPLAPKNSEPEWFLGYGSK
ncbi:unnamed protein product [Linum tenue]|uniref:F-box domain-containing protein n=1 Tax=Linum tenue TaxID=586396 RepID=A0AAV0JSC5_9ROSI|nr:unnamed protein product [Linum tenue]